MPAPRTLAAVLAALPGAAGPGPSSSVGPADPWEHAAWITCAYLVDDARRAATFADLRAIVGLAPEDAVAALAAVAALREHGRAVCRTGAPRCVTCALSSGCEWHALHPEGRAP